MKGPTAAGHGVPLCRLDELADPGARGFEVAIGDSRHDIIVVRHSGAVFGYINSCPHQGTPLETFPDRFLTRDGSQLLCTTHGARFQLGDGVCVAGPCKGRALARVSLSVIAAHVYFGALGAA